MVLGTKISIECHKWSLGQKFYQELVSFILNYLFQPIQRIHFNIIYNNTFSGSSRNVFQHQSWSFFRSTVDLFESAARQKFRQYIWVRSFYRRFFDKNLMLRLRQPKYLLCGAAVINKNHLISEESDFDWKKEKISNTESKQYFEHIDQCHEIEKKTITCKICNKRLR